MLFRRITDWPTGALSPFEELERMRRQMDWLTSGLSRSPARESTAGVFPLMNVTEDKDKYFVRAELPGMTKKNIAIAIQDNVLTIQGEKKRKKKTKNENFYLVERSFGQFYQSFTLPAPVEQDKVKATFAHGVLTITLPKTEGAKPHRIAIATL